MKLKDILREIEEAKKVNIDDMILKGFSLEPEKIDPLTGTTTSTVHNAIDLKKDLNYLYSIYKDITKYKGSSNETIKESAININKQIAYIIKQIKDLEQYIELVRRGIPE